MTEWEQIKKEYKEIPVPADGSYQMLEVIAEAKHKRDRWKHIAKYGSIVAAAMLVLMILPGIVLFSGGFGGSNDMAALESAVSKEESTGSNEWFTKDSAESVVENSNMALKPDTEYNNKTNAGASNGNGTVDSSPEMAEADSMDYGMHDKFVGAESGTNSMLTPAAGQESPEQSMDSTELNREEKMEGFSLPLDAVSAEILRQMEERMKETEETYYIKSETCPNGFVRITEEQECYINEEGLYVIVFEAGKVAPKEQGKIEFVIPAEVVQP